MPDSLTRRSFMGLVPGIALAPNVSFGQDGPAVHADFPNQDPALVRETVGASHANIDRVKELVAQSPALAKCSYDWGFGDWESALGAASHMGRRDIAEVLIGAGARPDVFTFVMMGDLAAVKALVAAQPGVQRITGPHGITMLSHARMGGEQAKEVHDYLLSLGDANPTTTYLPVTEEEKAVYIGRYEFGPGKDDALEVLKNSQGNLSIRRGDRFGRALNRVEPHAFAPSGAPGVRVRFVVVEGRAVSVSIHDPSPLVTAKRV